MGKRKLEDNILPFKLSRENFNISFGFGFSLESLNKKFTIYRILHDSIAQKCGLKRGDIVLLINGIKIDDMNFDGIVELFMRSLEINLHVRSV